MLRHIIRELDEGGVVTTPFTPPEWAFEFHGHRCPFMPIGYRMGRLAMERLGVEREKDHGFYVVAELGEGHPQTCMMDGIQAATGATYGKLLLSSYLLGQARGGVLPIPRREPCVMPSTPTSSTRWASTSSSSTASAASSPPRFPSRITDDLVAWISGLPDETVFKVEDMPGLRLRAGQGLVQQDQVLQLRRVRLRPLRPHQGRRSRSASPARGSSIRTCSTSASSSTATSAPPCPWACAPASRR